MKLKILSNEIEVLNEGDKYMFEDIYYVDKMDRNMMWRVYVIGNCIYREVCIDEGKVRVYEPYECIGKNAGKRNETSGWQQAILEAWSMW